jgi:hypothetical protein
MTFLHISQRSWIPATGSRLLASLWTRWCTEYVGVGWRRREGWGLSVPLWNKKVERTLCTSLMQDARLDHERMLHELLFRQTGLYMSYDYDRSSLDMLADRQQSDAILCRCVLPRP